MFSRQQIYRAFHDAADWIERNPKLYNFHAAGVPPCGTPGCMWGWVGHFLKLPAFMNTLSIGTINSNVAKACGFGHTKVLYDHRPDGERLHCYIASDAAKILRSFADVHFALMPVEQGLEAAFEKFKATLGESCQALWL